MGEQGSIGIEHTDDAQAGEVMTFGHHLGAHHDVHFARMHLLEQLLRAALQAGAVRVDTHQAGIGKTLAQKLFNTLSATPHRLQVLIAAIRTSTRDRGLITAMVALQIVLEAILPVQHGVHRATRTLRQPAARGAMQHRRIATPVDKHQRLLATVQTCFQRIQQLGRKARLQAQMAGIDQTHSGQGNLSRTLGQAQQAIAPLSGMIPAFQRRGG